MINANNVERCRRESDATFERRAVWRAEMRAAFAAVESDLIEWMFLLSVGTVVIVVALFRP